MSKPDKTERKLPDSLAAATLSNTDHLSRLLKFWTTKTISLLEKVELIWFYVNSPKTVKGLDQALVVYFLCLKFQKSIEVANNIVQHWTYQ